MSSRENGSIQYLLFIVSDSPKSRQAQQNLLKLCGEDKVQVIDIMENPEQAQKHGILATPTVIRTTDSVTIVGTLNDLERTSKMLGLPFNPNALGGTNV